MDLKCGKLIRVEADEELGIETYVYEYNFGFRGLFQLLKDVWSSTEMDDIIGCEIRMIDNSTPFSWLEFRVSVPKGQKPSNPQEEDGSKFGEPQVDKVTLHVPAETISRCG